MCKHMIYKSMGENKVLQEGLTQWRKEVGGLGSKGWFPFSRKKYVKNIEVTQVSANKAVKFGSKH